ncbi:hypothetical protein HOF92_05340 [bacterium]|jgi:hypothetical protein|nr:hypothetical protein [bacterium]
MSKKRILLASFYGYIPEYIFPEFTVLNALSSRGHELHVLNTGPNPRVIPGLEVVNLDPMGKGNPTLNNHLQSFERKLEKAYPQFQYHSMNNLLDDEDLEEVTSFVTNLEIATDLSNYSEIEFRAVNLGRSSLFRALRAQQLESLAGVDDTTRQGFRFALKCGALCVILAQKLAERHVFDAVIVSHYNYTCSKSFVTALQQVQKVKLLPLTAPNIMGRHMERRLTAVEQDRDWMDRNLQTWESVKSCPRGDYSLVGDHFENLFQGRALAGSTAPVSGSSQSIHERWNLDPGRKIVVAALNSPDEIFAVEKIWGEFRMRFVFPSQLDWLEKLARYFESRTDVTLIVRPHPRSFHRPTGRRTAHLEEILELSKSFPKNVLLNPPWEDVSNHEIMKACSHLLVSYSTAAFEYGLFGIGTLSYTHDYELAPLWDLGEIPVDEEAYFRQLGQILDKDYRLDVDRIRTCFRWFHYLMSEMTLDLSPVLRYKKHVWPESVVKVQRSIQKFLYQLGGLTEPYNPIWFLPDGTYKDMKHIQEMVEKGSDLAPLKAEELPECSSDQEWLEISTALDRLVRHLFGFPSDLRIRYFKKFEGPLEPSEFYLTLHSELRDPRVRIIQMNEPLLDQLGQLLYEDRNPDESRVGSTKPLPAEAEVTWPGKGAKIGN